MHGTRLVFGLCILSGGLITLLMPIASRWHYGAVIALRIIQGVLQVGVGVCFVIRQKYCSIYMQGGPRGGEGRGCGRALQGKMNRMKGDKMYI